MQKNKKSGKRIENVGIIIAAVLCYVLGFTCVIFAMLGEEWKVPRTWQVLLAIVGVAAMLLVKTDESSGLNDFPISDILCLYLKIGMDRIGARSFRNKLLIVCLFRKPEHTA